jgi:hypothetical protein
VSSFLLDDGGKLHGGLKMFGTGPEPESFEVPPPAGAVVEPDQTPPAEEAIPDEGE